MYEDGWYSFVPELGNGNNGRAETPSGRPRGHQRKESLLQQPNVGVGHPSIGMLQTTYSV